MIQRTMNKGELSWACALVALLSLIMIGPTLANSVRSLTMDNDTISDMITDEVSKHSFINFYNANLIEVINNASSKIESPKNAEEAKTGMEARKDESVEAEEEEDLPDRNNVLRGIDSRIESLEKSVFQDNVSGGRANSLCSKRHKNVLTPYLQSGGSDRMVIRWRTVGKGQGVVCYGSSADNMKEFKIEAGSWPKYVARRDVDTWDTIEAAEHQVEITGLAPHTKYFYTVGFIPDGANPMSFENGQMVSMPAGSYYSFRTFPEPKAKIEKPIRVWAFGDSGWGDHKAIRIRDAFANYTGGDWDLSIGLGDLAYLKGKDWEYQKRFFNFLSEQNARVPVFTTPGNHDRYGGANSKLQMGPYYEFFTNPGDGKSGGVPSNHKSYYSFDYGPIHFVSVDSDQLGLEDDPTLYAWLEKDLAEAQKANYSWIVAYHHQPPYSKGSHDSDEQYECFKLRRNLVPMFEKYGVDLVLSGHSHSYERSHLLSGHHGSSHEIHSNPSVIRQRWTEDGNGLQTLEKASCGANSGTMYIVTGGAAIRAGGKLNHPAMSKSIKNRGSMLLQFHEDRLEMWLLGEHRDEKDDYAGFTKILDEALYRKTKRLCKT